MIAYNSQTVSNTAIQLDSGNGRGMSDITKAVVTTEGAAIRFRIDSVLPTASEGHILYDGDHVYLYGEEVYNFRAIRMTTADAIIKVSYTYLY